jgi:hypothetical protein
MAIGMGWWQEEDESYKDLKMVVKCNACCVSLFVGLFLSIPQIIEKEREPNLLGTRKEIWDFCNKDIPWCEDKEVSIFLVQAFNVDNGF